MPVELRPLGVACNIGCHYCYQNPQREARNHRQSYDMAKMRAAVEKERGPFTLFGGEPLLLPIEALEELLQWGFERYGGSGMQTNAVLITDEHLSLFARYNVDVGVSIDGPAECNDLRWDASLERTRTSTALTEANIARLCREHRPPGLIVTLHRLNATAERLPRMYDWMRELDALGIKSVRLHALEVDAPEVREHSLSDAENARAFLGFAALQRELKALRFDVVDEIERSLMGRDAKASCVWRACDPYTTEAVRGVEGNGQASNCGRTNKDGVDFIKADAPGYERYLALQQTPQEEGGCKGCRFFLMCRGQCPGTALHGDWRNRSELCGLWKQLFIHAEKQLILRNLVPLTLDPTRHWRERHLALQWASGRNSSTELLPCTEPASQQPSGFSLPPFLRRAFVGDAQRALWQPRFDAIMAAAPRLGVAASLAGIAPASLAHVAAADVIVLHNEAARAGVHTRILGASGKRQQWQRVVIGSETAVAVVEQAWRSGDPAAIDAALRIPACCRAAAEALRRASSLDPVVRVARSSSAELRSSAATNFLLRPLGIDLLGYAPCSFECEESRLRGEALLLCGQRAGIAAIEWLEAILGWPMEWSALHGIAEIKTPIMKLAYATDYTPAKLTLRYRGTALPRDAARGLTFAFQRARSLPIVVQGGAAE
jgi:uncharacterized protein